MTRREIEALRDALKSQRDISVQWPDELRAVKGCADAVADAMASVNPRFDKVRFLREIGFVYKGPDYGAVNVC